MMFFPLLMLAQSAGASPIVSSANYPAEAYRLGHQGDVSIEVTVGIDGRAHDCKVVKSSGYRELDDASCQTVVSRARFTPAKDDKGNPKEDRWATTIHWRLPS